MQTLLTSLLTFLLDYLYLILVGGLGCLALIVVNVAKIRHERLSRPIFGDPEADEIFGVHHG